MALTQITHRTAGRLCVLVLAFLIALLPGMVLGQAAFPAQCSSASAKTQTPAPGQGSRPVRVRTDISSFHLERNLKLTPNQIGATSRGDHSILTLCAPHSGIASSARPLFVWQLPSTSNGQVHFSLASPSGDVLFEMDVTGNSLEYPADAPAIAPGESFIWNVSAKGGMDKLPPYDLVQVQDKSCRERIQKELAAAPADPLARAQIFLDHQVWYDAIAELQKGLQANPARKDLAEQLQVLYRGIAPSCSDSPPGAR